MKMPRKKSATNNHSKSAPQTALAAANRCDFETSDGRRCRMPRHNDHPALCPFHAREEMQLLESLRLGSELSASLTGQFMTATDINFVLGKLFTALAQGRIPRRNAATLAYIGHLMLHSLSDLKKEYCFAYNFQQWSNMLDHATPLSNSSPGTPSLNPPNDPQNS